MDNLQIKAQFTKLNGLVTDIAKCRSKQDNQVNFEGGSITFSQLCEVGINLIAVSGCCSGYCSN